MKSFNKTEINYLKNLCEVYGPSGFEINPLKIVKKYMKKYSDNILTDKLGSHIFQKNGDNKNVKILLPAHIDEVGFIVSSINEKGFLTFNPIGGWFDQVLLGQRVVIHTEKSDIYGVIVSKPPHVLDAEERKRIVKKENMYIDIGCSNKEEVENLDIQIGNGVTPVSDFYITKKKIFTDKKQTGSTEIISGKGFDDRLGVFIGSMVLQNIAKKKLKHPNTVYFASTVQEEVGLRGARTTANLINPDICITLEVDIAGDVPGIPEHKAQTKIGKGVSILTYDGSMIPNQKLKKFVIDTANSKKISSQLSQVAGGGTDAGIVHISNIGCPSIVLGVPTRHIHSHIAIADIYDVECAVNLIIELIKKLDKKTVKSFTEI